MRIIRIDLRNFGKFENLSLTFPDGFVILQGENESGKTTLLDFLQLMFYGTKKEGRDPRENVRLRYAKGVTQAPEGTVLFEDGKSRYRLWRSIGSTKAKDKIQLIQEETGEEVPLSSQESPGEFFFGLSMDAFKRSVFLGPSGSIFTTANGKEEDELMDRLMNLQQSGEEMASANLAKERLDKAEKQFRKKNRTGWMDKREEQRKVLEQELQKARESEAEKKAAEQSLAAEKEKLMTWEAQELRLRKEREGWQERVDALDRIQAFEMRQAIDKKWDEEKIANQEAQQHSLSGIEEDWEKKRNEFLERGNALQRREVTLQQERHHAKEKRRLLEEKNEMEQASFSKDKMTWQEQIPSDFPLLVFLILGILSLLAVFFLGIDRNGAILIGGMLMAVVSAIGLLFASKKTREKRMRIQKNLAELEEKRNTALQQFTLELAQLDDEKFTAREAEIEAQKKELEEEKQAGNLLFQKEYQAAKSKQDQVDRIRWQREQLEDQLEARFPTLANLSTADFRVLLERGGLDPSVSPDQIQAAWKESSVALEQKQKEISEMQLSLVQKENEVREHFRAVRNIDTIEEERRANEEVLTRMGEDMDVLELAKEALEEAMEEARLNFSPVLNRRTSAIFHQLTGKEEGKIRVGSDFGLSWEAEKEAPVREWRLLSTGTVEQAYLALRIAVAEMITGDRRIPFFMDDSFITYDDRRAKQGMSYLKTYAETQKKQILFFTAHGRYLPWAKEQNIPVISLRDAQEESENVTR